MLLSSSLSFSYFTSVFVPLAGSGLIGAFAFAFAFAGVVFDFFVGLSSLALLSSSSGSVLTLRPRLPGVLGVVAVPTASTRPASFALDLMLLIRWMTAFLVQSRQGANTVSRFLERNPVMMVEMYVTFDEWCVQRMKGRHRGKVR